MARPGPPAKAALRDACLLLALVQARSGASAVARLRRADIPLEAVLELPSAQLAERAGLTRKTTAAIEALRPGFDAETVLAGLYEKGARAVTLADEEYPEDLGAVPDPPPALFVKGDLAGALAGPAVALVGSRRATASGLEVARRVSRGLAERGVCVVSGLALGVDAAAHEGALEAGGPTIGVLGCGIDVVYPRGNGRLYGEVESAGAVVSEYGPEEAPLPWRFPARNRIVAGLAGHVVVVEAAEKSGALITARHASEGGREVWAVPGPLLAPECRGSNRLLADGAGVLWDAEEFLEAVAPEPAPPEPARLGLASGVEDSVPEGLPEGERVALGHVGFEPTAVDAVVGRSGRAVRELLPALTMLEIKGYVRREAGGLFVRVTAGGSKAGGGG